MVFFKRKKHFKLARLLGLLVVIAISLLCRSIYAENKLQFPSSQKEKFDEKIGFPAGKFWIELPSNLVEYFYYKFYFYDSGKQNQYRKGAHVINFKELNYEFTSYILLEENVFLSYDTSKEFQDAHLKLITDINKRKNFFPEKNTHILA